MPVRRVGGATGSVFAYTHELDDWLQAEMELSAAESPEEHETPSERPVTTGGARRNRREQQTQPSNRRSLRP